MVTVAILSPGAMGAALGRGWAEAGHRVVASVAGRSARTRELAHGIELLDSVHEAVAAADVIISIVPPDQCLEVARVTGEAAARVGRTPLFADLNAVAPSTVREVQARLGDLPLVDGSISGGPPNQPGTRLYLSGDRAAEIAGLGHPRLDVHVLDAPVGAASALKMSTASVYKGMAALLLHACAAAEDHGVLQETLADLGHTYPEVIARVGPLLATSGAKAHRYVGEMREIATTQGASGLSPDLFEAMATVWGEVASTALGALTPEQGADMTDVETVLRLLRRLASEG